MIWMFVMLNAVLQEVAIAGEFCAATDETRKAVKTPRMVEKKFKVKAAVTHMARHDW